MVTGGTELIETLYIAFLQDLVARINTSPYIHITA
jgi:hypothetical protein